MQTETVLLILLAALVALLVALFQYFYRNKRRGKYHKFLAFLRFLGIFGILLLLINPQFATKSYSIEKPILALLVDNSTSVSKSEGEIRSFLNALQSNQGISDKFTVDTYLFGEGLKPGDSLSFNEKGTNIDRPLTNLSEAYRRRERAVVLISDGNQTLGKDYAFAIDTGHPVYTVTVGDTTSYADLSVGPINTNKYAFLNNKFPLETYVSYQGTGEITAKVVITLEGTSVYSERFSLSASNNLKNIAALISAKSIGQKSIEVQVTNLPSERNTENNIRETTVEVIDEKTNIALISDILHPDLGAFKKSIESNEQRKVHFLSSDTKADLLNEMDLFILYEPNSRFAPIMEYVRKSKSNYMIVAGLHTDFKFLNEFQSDVTVESGYPEQEVFGSLNSAFTKYDISDFDLDNLPPLSSKAGPVVANVAQDILLDTRVMDVDINTPMLSLMGEDTWKRGLWLGVDIWQWRAQSFRNYGDFTNFDSFMGKLVRYLTSTAKRDRLNLDYNTRFEGSNTAIITATYFDQTFVFDPNANLEISIAQANGQNKSSRPMILKNGYYEVDLSDLAPGSYEFTVRVANENLSKKGSFVISDFNLEKQFVSSNYKKMATLSENTGGGSFFPSQENELIKALMDNESLKATQKSTENVVSLIDYRILLAIIIVAFSLEWFLRKYNGLI